MFISQILVSLSYGNIFYTENQELYHAFTMLVLLSAISCLAASYKEWCQWGTCCIEIFLSNSIGLVSLNSWLTVVPFMPYRVFFGQREQVGGVISLAELGAGLVLYDGKNA